VGGICPQHPDQLCHHSSSSVAAAKPGPRHRLPSSARITSSANRHRTRAPIYQVSQKVWLSTLDLPLWIECKKLAPRFISPVASQKVINSAAVRLQLPHSMRFHHTFHVSRVNLVWENPLMPAAPPHPPTSRVDGRGETMGPRSSHPGSLAHHGVPTLLFNLAFWLPDHPPVPDHLSACYFPVPPPS